LFHAGGIKRLRAQDNGQQGSGEPPRRARLWTGTEASG